MAVAGPDSGYSWVIVFCCAYIHFALFGLFRSAGVMYVALLQSYDVTREEASWPFSLCSAVFQLTGPVASVLTHYLSQRKSCLLGSAVATLGVAGCYFADNVRWINIFYGIVHGLGFGLVVTFVPVFINQYFTKHRATALGIAFSGGTISSFIFPVVLEWLLENYGIRGSFLLLGGVVMNTLVVSSLLRTPPWLKKRKNAPQKVLDDAFEAEDSGVSTSDVANGLKIPADTISCSPIHNLDLKKDSIVGDNLDHQKVNTLSTSVDNELQLDNSESNADGTLKDENLDTVYSNNDSLLFSESNNKSDMSNSSSTYKNFNGSDFIRDATEVQEPLVEKNALFIVPKRNDGIVDSKSKKFKCMVSNSITDIVKEPMFHLITFTMAIYFMGIHSFFMVIVDFAKDKGIAEAKGIYIISMFSLTDLIGRAGLGWVTDKNYIKRKTMVMLNLFVLGIINQIYPVLQSLPGILVIAAFHGLAVGSSITLFFVLQAEYLGMKRLTLAVGLTSFINGALTLIRPAMIGLFRDVIGSYNWMFHFIGIISFLFSIIWFAESWLTQNKKIPNNLQDAKV